MGRRSKRKHTPEEIAKAERKELLSICNQILEVAMRQTPITPAKQWEEFTEINNLVKKIQTKQQNDNLFTSKREDNLDVFVAWLKKNDVAMDKVMIVDYGVEGYGLQAAQDIKADDVFLCIPRQLMITDDDMKASYLGPLAKSDRILSTMPHVALALFLLSEKISAKSTWQPYIDFLPQQYNVPLYFTPEELKYLKGSHTFGEALKQHKNIARQYAYFYKLFQTNQDASKLALRDRFTYNAYRWAVSTVMSRQNQIPHSLGNHLITALIPEWDMCNHANGTITTGYSMPRATSESVAEKAFKKGDQLHIFYGGRPNAHFLLYSGFVYPPNDHDTIAIQLGISKNDRLYAMKSQILAMLMMPEPSHTFYIHKNGEPISVELWTFLRVFLMDEEQLKDLLLSPQSHELLSKLIKPNCIVSKQNETNVWRFLDTRLRLLHQQYQTLDKEGDELQKDDNLSYNAKLCIKLCQCEKKTLENAIDHIVLQQLRVEDIPDGCLYYIPQETTMTAPEPPLASEEDSDITTTTNSERNSRESDFDDASDDPSNEQDNKKNELLEDELLENDHLENDHLENDHLENDHLENGVETMQHVIDSNKSDSGSTLTNSSELSQVTVNQEELQLPVTKSLDQNHNPNEDSKRQTTSSGTVESKMNVPNVSDDNTSESQMHCNINQLEE